MTGTGNDKAMADWLALGQDWQQAVTPAIDVAALQRTINQRSRTLRLALLTDLAVAGVALTLCLWSMLATEHTAQGIAGHVALMVLVLGWMGWGLWQRRQQWRVVDQAPDALLVFELARTRTSLRLARTSIWLTTAISLALFLVVTAAPESWWPDQGEGRAALYRGLWGMLVINAASAVIVSIHSRRQRQRWRHLCALKASLQDPP